LRTLFSPFCRRRRPRSNQPAPFCQQEAVATTFVISTAPSKLHLASQTRLKDLSEPKLSRFFFCDEAERIRISIDTFKITTSSASAQIFECQNEGWFGTIVFVPGPSPVMRYLWVLVRQVVPSEKGHGTG
jgi:hypothetical protein